MDFLSFLSYFVLPVPALHSFVIPRPGEGDLETVKGNKWNSLCGRESAVTVMNLVLFHSPLCKEELSSLA